MTYKLNSIQKAHYIENNLKRYIKSTFQIDDAILNNQFNTKIDDEEILKGPYISGRLPFVEGKSLLELINEGILSQEFLKMPALKLERPLYKHQEEAVRKSVENRNLVVSTGTGSGKTESFLIPILNDIARDIEIGKENRGIQALLLYPLNALANDQRARVREILSDYPEITFGFYIGETENSERKAVKEYMNEFGIKPLKNEIISREVSRETPPNILFTNYSMLEYLLLRPSDENLFSEKNTSEWKYIVLDEAHTYVGSLGIEISYLIKRLLGSISSKPKFILTSATLATDANDFPSVIEFAEKLTSSNFTKESIIISRYQNYKAPSNLISISPENYASFFKNNELVSNLHSSVFGLESKLNKIEKIRELILHSEDFYNFISFLETPIKAHKMIDLLGHPWNEQFLSDYLNLLARVNKEDTKIIFDVRYHSFIKTLDGAYVSLKPEKKLSLKKTAVIRLGDGSFQDEVAALQLGLCKYCSIPYVLGHIVDNTFHQIDDEDLYEVYGEDNPNNVDLLLVKEFANFDNINMDKKIEYVLCNKCGFIHDKDVIKPNVCACGDSYKIGLIGYDKSDLSNKSLQTSKTNIHKCISCESQNNSGVVNSFYIGKDSATAIIGQLLYQSMDPKTSLAKNIKANTNPFLSVDQEIEQEKQQIKQYITFSDSRQQASYFALFFENQHIDFLRKRLVLEVIKNRKNLPITAVEHAIQYKFEEEDLYPYKRNLQDQGWITILIELLDVNRKFSLSGLGQLSFNYNINEKSEISPDELMELFNNTLDSNAVTRKITYLEFKAVIKYILNSMRRIPAIYYKDHAMLDRETRAEFFTYRQDDRAGLVLEPNDKEKYQKSLLPYSKSGNIYTSYLCRGLGISFEESKIVLENIWNYLCRQDIFINNDSSLSQNIKVDYISVTDGKYIDWYQCDKCKTITELNLNNVCVNKDCSGSLVTVDIDDIMSNNFYIKQYKEKTIEKIVIKEHTAQIESKEARIIQKDFKDQKVNILSSSTTFEMGVDVGSLDTVYMRNVPPLPANYVQRSGRAGRTKETAAFVLTFASNNSHDYTFFEDPLKMINGKIRAPYFDVNNSKIANRHITSFALSKFFKKYPDYFSNSKLAGDQDIISLFFEFVEDQKETIIKFVEENNIIKDFRNNFMCWMEDNITGSGTKLQVMYHNHTTKISQLEEAREDAYKNNINYGNLSDLLNDLRNQSMLKTLSQYGVIPSYGFPVDSVSLNIPNVKRFKLDRDLGTAISEYAPSSEIIVDKNKYRSRYINVGGKNSLPHYFYVKCDDCNAITHSLNENDESLNFCRNCSSENIGVKKKFVIPVNGFTSELNAIKEKQIKPKKTYSSDYYYIGNSGEFLQDIEYRDTIRLKSSKDTELAILNENNFYMCETCGYTELEPNQSIFPNSKKNHKKPGSNYNCSNSILNRSSLGHTFFTDVIIFDITSFEYKEKEMRSFMYALLEGISISLEIERNDINGIVQNIDGRYQLILFDTVPGGAGHVSRLLDETILFDVLKETFNKVNQTCCDESSSCYNCLRNYKNQKIHPLLKRGDARKVARDIQRSINRRDIPEYYIDNDSIEADSWTQINDMFDREFSNLVGKVKLPSKIYADLVINGKRNETFLIWESSKVAIVTSESVVDTNYSDWRLFTINQIEELVAYMEELHG